MSAVQVLIDGFVTAAELAALLFVTPAAEPPRAETPFLASGADHARPLHLMSSTLDVRFVGTLADVRVSQRFPNDGDDAVDISARMRAADDNTEAMRIRRNGRTVDLMQIDSGCDHEGNSDDAAEAAATAGHARLSLDEMIADAMRLSPGETVATEWIVTRTALNAEGLRRIALPASAVIDAQALLVDQPDAQFVVVIPDRFARGTARLTLRPDHTDAQIIDLAPLNGTAAAYVIPIADRAALHALAAGAIEIETRTLNGIVWSTLPAQIRGPASGTLAHTSN